MNVENYPCCIELHSENEHEIKLYNKEKPHLQKTIKNMKQAGITPHTNEAIIGEESLYHIEYIWYHKKFYILILVNVGEVS